MEQRNNSGVDLFFTISTLKTKEEYCSFFSEILSIFELETIENRWQMLNLLHNGVSHRDISRQLGVGVTTISRANKLLKKENSFCKSLISKPRGD